MYINLLIQCGEQSPGEAWETVKEFEDRGSGIGIMTRSINGGRQLLVEFKVGGIVWRRTLFAVVLPAEAGARTIFDPTQYTIALSTIEGFYHSEVQGREPCLYISTLAGTRYITQSQGIAVMIFEKEQQTFIQSTESMSTEDMARELLTFTEDDYGDDQIGDMSWATKDPDITIELDGIDLSDGKDDFTASAFYDWSGNDEDPDNEG